MGSAQGIVGLAKSPCAGAGEAQEEGEGVLGEVDAHTALLAGQGDVALHQLGSEDGVHPGPPIEW